MMPYITELEQLVGKKKYRKILKKEYKIEQSRSGGVNMKIFEWIIVGILYAGLGLLMVIGTAMCGA